MTGSLLLAGRLERLHDAVAVLGVDPQQFANHEAQRSPLARGTRLHALPQAKFDASQVVVGHGCSALHSILRVSASFDDRPIIGAPSRDHRDDSEMADTPSSGRPTAPDVVEDGPLKTFIDRVIVPMLTERLLAEQQPAPAEKRTPTRRSA